jgi:hypothetical protein
MTRNKRELLLAKTVSRTALCMAVSMAFVGAAMADPGGLRITILGNTGQPLAGATVKISSPDSLVAKTVVTDEKGNVRVSGLDPATNYTVEVVSTRSMTVSIRHSSGTTPPSVLIRWLRLNPVAIF